MAKAYQSALVCSKGCVRSNNEDNYYFLGEYMPLEDMDKGAHVVTSGSEMSQAYAIFDGMGGGDSGEVASFMAAQLFASYEKQMMSGDTAALMDLYVRKISGDIEEYAREHHATGQGTTLAALLIRGGKAFVANVGDSRVYLLRRGELQLVTQDHSMVFGLYQAGQLTLEQARKHPKNNVITRFLGMRQDQIVKDFIYTDEFKVQRGDRFMLCSDGLCDLIPNKAIERMLTENATPDEAAVALVHTALEMGGKDNTTCIVTDVLDFKPPEE